MVGLPIRRISSDNMPDRYTYLKNGERDIDNAMPWDKIDPTDLKWLGTTILILIKPLQIVVRRISINPNFQLIEENAKWIDSK
jgi:carboxyl-terminal processing protease